MKFITPQQLQEEIPFTREHRDFVYTSRCTIANILNAIDPRLLLIVGPCSIHDLDSAREYAVRFRRLADRVSDQFFLIMRAYFEKPRTVVGWKGMLYDPDLDGSYNLAKGLRCVRQFLVDLTEMGVVVGSELVEIVTAPYYCDFLSWGCIGARTSASPPHRQLAANLPFPIGFKNTPDGNIDNPIHAVLSASQPQVFLGISPLGHIERIQTEGNRLCHVVLRGGSQSPNYQIENILTTVKKCRQANIFDKLVIDCSHDNCEKKYLKQVPIFEKIIDQVVEGSQMIRGIMAESNLYSGSQTVGCSLRYGVSVTDPCLGWEATEKMILQAYKKLNEASCVA